MVAIIAGSVVGGLCCGARVVARIVPSRAGAAAERRRRAAARADARRRSVRPGLGEAPAQHGSEKMALTVQGSSGGVMATKI